jgi:hypothetical protein
VAVKRIVGVAVGIEGIESFAIVGVQRESLADALRKIGIRGKVTAEGNYAGVSGKYFDGFREIPSSAE